MVAATTHGGVVFAEIWAMPRREMGAVIRPFQAGKVLLESQHIGTRIILDP
jgi:hypothetical protein